MSPYYRLMITALLSKKTTMNFLSPKKNHRCSRKQQRFFKIPSRPRRNLSLQSHLTGLLGYFNRLLRQWKQLRRPQPRISSHPMPLQNLFSLPRLRVLSHAEARANTRRTTRDRSRSAPALRFGVNETMEELKESTRKAISFDPNPTTRIHIQRPPRGRA